jgi:hypothetical protein
LNRNVVALKNLGIPWVAVEQVSVSRALENVPPEITGAASYSCINDEDLAYWRKFIQLQVAIQIRETDMNHLIRA